MEVGLISKVFLMLQLFRTADCILCYQCDSLNYRTCAVQTCAGNRCQTRTAMNGQVTHLCGVPMGADGCRTSFGEKICICATDKCNNEGINESQNDNGAGGIGQAAFQMVLACGLLIRAVIL